MAYQVLDASARRWGKALKILIEETGLSVSEVGRRTGVSTSLAICWTNGKARIGKENYEALCKVVPKAKDIEAEPPLHITGGEAPKMPKRIITTPDKAKKLRAKVNGKGKRTKVDTGPWQDMRVRVEPFNLKQHFVETADQAWAGRLRGDHQRDARNAGQDACHLRDGQCGPRLKGITPT